MRHPDQWSPSRLVKDPRTGRFRADRTRVWAGSHYIADLQCVEYVPMIQTYIAGDVLDLGCGTAPYYEVYRPKASSVTCVDRSADERVRAVVDVVADIDRPLPFPDASFDAVLLTDVIAHVRDPWALMREISRVLRPGGHLVLTTPFIYWLCEYPNDFFHPSRFALEELCARSGQQVQVLRSYGGQADVLMDTLNKMFPSGLGHRLFMGLVRILDFSGWLRRDRERTRETYSLGYVLVTRRA
ncbi:MAG: class I SAM-dependent methyltransferase [Flavobacteriales bacterium]|nr:class I SAM-dependent methyltransferase [Flavobacteriales bacterium]